MRKKTKIVLMIVKLICTINILQFTNFIYASTNEIEDNYTNNTENIKVTNNIIEEDTENDNSSVKSLEYKQQPVKKNGIYKIAVGKESSKVIEVRGANIENTAIVDIWNYGNAAQQKFYFEYQEEGYYKITAMHTGKSLTAKDNKIIDGTQIVQEDFQGLNSQKWILRDSKINGWIISPLNRLDLALTIENAIQNGQNIKLTSLKYNEKQMFYLFNISKEEQIKTNGIYKIAVVKDPSKVIEVRGASKENNAIVDIWNYGNAEQQKFYFEYQEEGYYKITAMHTGKSLTAKGNKIEKGTQIVQEEFQGLNSQKWIIRDSKINGWIISPLNRLDLSLSVENTIQNGQNIKLTSLKYNDNQMFSLLNISIVEQTKQNGIYKIAVGKDSSKVIEVRGASIENTAIVDIWNYGNAEQQKFYFEYQEEGYYKITAMHTGKSLTAKDNKIEEGTQIVQEEFTGLNSQKWIIRDSKINGWVISPLNRPDLAVSVENKIQNGQNIRLEKLKYNNNQLFYIFNISKEEQKKINHIYKIAVGKDSSKVIEVKGASRANTAIVDIWNYGNAEQQKFYFEYQEEGYYKITAMHTGKSLTAKDNKIEKGTQIVQEDFKGLNSQKWIIKDSKINGWIISPLNRLDLALSVKNTIQNGANIELQTLKYSDTQMFYLSKIIDLNIKEGEYGKSGLMYKGTGGQYLKYYQIGKGNKCIFLNFAIHGFEDSYNYDGQELTFIANELFNYLKNNYPEDYVEKYTIYILPSLNPDGEYNGYTNNGPGRTTLYSWANNHKGIDMNRCFPVGYYSTKVDRNYNGEQPLQAYEAEALRDFILKNKGKQNIVIDVHGWLNETIGDYDIGKYYRNEFGITKHIYTYGNGYLINWARSIANTRSMLLELPEIKSHNQLLENRYIEKFIRGTMNLMKNF